MSRKSIQARSASEWVFVRLQNHSLVRLFHGSLFGVRSTGFSRLSMILPKGGTTNHLRRMVKFLFALRACITLAILCTSFHFANAQENSKRFKHEKHGAIVFAEGEDYELTCDIYQPISDEPRPVMLAIHGGAWTTGSKLAMFRHARILANRGYVVMAPNYRLAPKHKWPAQIHDCKHAVRWIREHAEKYNADPDRVYVFGYSAGGHLGAMLAATDKDDGLEGEVKEPYSKHSSRIDGLIAGGSPMEFSWIGDDATTLKHWLGDTKDADPEAYFRASPTTFLTADDPPCIVFHGTVDQLVPASSPEAFVARCGEVKVEAELVMANGGHVAAFTYTSNLITCLAKLESSLLKETCNEKIDSIVNLIEAFTTSRGHLPPSVAELRAFAENSLQIKPVEFDQMLFNERDGKPFEILWGSSGRARVFEAVGVDGEKLSGITGSRK